MTSVANTEVENIITERGFERFGFTSLTRPLTMDFYLSWLENDHHGEMAYLKSHAAQKADPSLLLPQAKSAIVVAFNYLPHPAPNDEPVLKAARTALYSKGLDYHHWMKERLQNVCQDLKKKYPDHEFASFVDSGPVLERDLARRAGLGWVGKNTCLIHPKFGSLFFIGEIYTSLELLADAAMVRDHCGTCRKCIDICPTNALSERNLDSRKCISYLTIENKEIPKAEFRTAIGDWLFGCDLCQTVCPWNMKFFKNEILIENQEPERALLIKDLQFILKSSNKSLAKSFKDSSMSRASGNKLKRNAVIVIANKKITELRAQVEAMKTQPYFEELCSWATDQLS
jgi:epoxyqueuosine reductase